MVDMLPDQSRQYSVSQSSSSSRPAALQSNLDQQQMLQSLLSYWGPLESNLFNWGTNAYNGLIDLTNPTIASQIYNQAQATGAADNQLGRYENKYQPQEDTLLNE